MIPNMVYEALGHFILDNIRTTMVGKTSDDHINKYFEAVQSTKAPVNIFLNNGKFLTSISSFVQLWTIDEIADYHRVSVIRNTSMSTFANKDSDTASEANFGQEALARRGTKAPARRALNFTASRP